MYTHTKLHTHTQTYTHKQKHTHTYTYLLYTICRPISLYKQCVQFNITLYYLMWNTVNCQCLIIKRYFHKRANRTRSSIVTATVYCRKGVTQFELRICVFLNILNCPQFKIQTQNASLA